MILVRYLIVVSMKHKKPQIIRGHCDKLAANFDLFDREGESLAEMSDTIFDKILTGEIPADKVYEDEEVCAFRDIAPQAPVHVLVIPKTKCQSFAHLHELDSAAVGRYMQKVAEVAESLGLKESGYRIIFNHGKDGQQTVDYIHAHILGGRGLKWPPG